MKIYDCFVIALMLTLFIAVFMAEKSETQKKPIPFHSAQSLESPIEEWRDPNEPD